MSRLQTLRMIACMLLMGVVAIATTPINNIQAIIRKVCKRLITLIFQVSDKERNG